MRPGLRISIAVAGLVAFPWHAHADWPTKASSPLVIGDTLGIGRDIAVVAAVDGATWIAWVDDSCFPTFFVQRIDAEGSLLVPGGLALVTQKDCSELAPRLQACSDGTVVASGIGSDPLSTPVHRIAPDGTELWDPSVVADGGFAGGISKLLAMPDGDALVAGPNGQSIMVGRYTADGTAVWDPPVRFATPNGPNMRIFALEPDGADGVYVMWDSPGAYTRRVHVMRIMANGTPAWADPVRVVDIPPGSSRHTDPIAIADGTTGLVLLWTQGAESPGTPVPIRMQRIFPDGTTMFDMDGRRVSTAATRQFEAHVRQREPGGDLYIAWRDGTFDGQEVRVQRMTLAGERVWGDTGILVTEIVGSASAFTMHWLDEETLGIAITNDPDDPEAAWVNVHRVDTLGSVAPDPWPISGAVPAGAIDGATLDRALAVAWLRAGEGHRAELVAQRINADGTLGLPPIVETICPDDPDDFLRTFGGTVSGDALDLCASDDVRLEVRQSARLSVMLPFIRLEFWAHSTLAENPITSVAYTIEGHVSAMVAGGQNPDTLRTSIRNYSGGFFEVIDQRGTGSNADEAIHHVQTTNAPDYVNAGDGEVRVRQDVFDPGNVLSPNWFLKVDLFEVTVSE